MAGTGTSGGDGAERDVTDWSPTRVGNFIRAELNRRSVRSVEVKKRRGRVIAISWFVDFDLPGSIDVAPDDGSS